MHLARIARKLRVNSSPLSGIPPVQQRSGKSSTGSGRTPDNHGQPGGVIQVLPVPDWGIANTGF